MSRKRSASSNVDSLVKEEDDNRTKNGDTGDVPTYAAGSTSASIDQRRRRLRAGPSEVENGSGSSVTPPSRTRRKISHADTNHTEAGDNVATAAAASSSTPISARAQSIPSSSSIPHLLPLSRPPAHRLALAPSISSNIVLSLRGRSQRILPTRRLYDRVRTLRTNTLQLSEWKTIKSVHNHSINQVDIDRTESRYLLSCGGDGIIAVYDVANEMNKRGYTAKAVNKHDPPRALAVSCVQWYPFDTGLFVSGSKDTTVTVWDTNTFTPAHIFKLQQMVHCAKMSQVATTHSLIATGTVHANVRLCDMTSGAFSHTLLGHKTGVLSLDWSPTNEFHLSTASDDGTVRVWDIRRAGAFMTLDRFNQLDPFINTRYLNHSDMATKRDVAAHDGATTCLAWMNDGLNLITHGTDRQIRYWDARTGKNLLLNYGVTGPPAKDVRFSVSVDNRSIFLPVRQHLHQYDVASGRLLRKFVGHFDRVLCSAMNEATQDLYSAGVDRNILVWTPKADEAKYEEDEEERDREEGARRRDMEAQEQDDRELQMRIVNSLSHHASPYQRPDEDAWSDDD